MAVSMRTYLMVLVRLLQIAFSATVLAVSISLLHVKDIDGKFLHHPPSALFTTAVSALTIAGGLFGLVSIWLVSLVKYGYVVDLLGLILNLAAGTLLAVKVKWTKKGCPTQERREEGYIGPAEAPCGRSKLDWLIGDKCEGMGMRCRSSQVASILCFVIVAMLLVTLAFGGFGKKRPGPIEAKRKKRPDGDVDMNTGTQMA